MVRGFFSLNFMFMRLSWSQRLLISQKSVSNNQFTDLLKVIILELPKLPERADENAVWPWLKFMKGKTGREFNELAKQYPEVRMAVAGLKRLSWSRKWRLIKEAEGLAREDMRMIKQYARKEGLAEGREEGREEGLALGEAKVKEAEAEAQKAIDAKDREIAELRRRLQEKEGL
ncbi:MAG: Rpn family recombination-promoting nuclease/putative transposase [Treponema sp.]|nr:Rpn family recombination-promoting nuclease/putative transposase [Treponema sp.]